MTQDALRYGFSYRQITRLVSRASKQEFNRKDRSFGAETDLYPYRT